MESKIKEYAISICKELPCVSEKVYQEALCVLLRQNGVPYEVERIIPVIFRGHTVGHVRADLIIDNQMIVELKKGVKILPAYVQQTKMYLRLLDEQGKKMSGLLILLSETSCEFEEVSI